MSSHNYDFTLTQAQHYVIDPTNPRRAFDDRIKHRLHVRRRPADDAKYFSRSSLMLQGFPQFGVAFL
jgi:hypothetical protein